MKLSEKEYTATSPYTDQRSSSGIYQLWDKDAEEWGPTFSAPNKRLAILKVTHLLRDLYAQNPGLLEGIQLYQVAKEYKSLPLNQEHVQGIIPLLIYSGIEYSLEEQREENKRIDNHITQPQD